MLRPMSIRSATGGRLSGPVTAAARRLDPQHVAGGELALALRRQPLAVQEVAARLPVSAPVAAPGRVAPALADQREPHRGQRLELAHDALAPAIGAAAAASAAHLQPADPQGELGLEGLDWGVQRV